MSLSKSVPVETLEKLNMMLAGALCYFSADAKHAQASDAKTLVETLLAAAPTAPAAGGETITPAKTQGELMSYREGYRIGLAAGKRAAQTKVAELTEERDSARRTNGTLLEHYGEDKMQVLRARIAALESQIRGRE